MNHDSVEELTIGDLVAVLKRRRRVISATIAATILLAAIYCCFATPRYVATGTIEVQKQNPDAASLGNLIERDASTSDALDANITLQTQANILTSDTFALNAINALNLAGTHDYQKHTDESPSKAQHVMLKRFKSKVKVSPVGGTRLIQIEFYNPDPKLASGVVENLIQQITDYEFTTQNAATDRTSKWLEMQLAALKKESETAQTRVADLQRQSGMYDLGPGDSQGHPQSYSGILDRLQQVTTLLTQAEQNRILKHAIAQSVENGDLESLSSLAGNVNGTAINYMAVIQNLRQQEATQTATLKEMQAKFGPQWPKVKELKQSIQGLQETIHNELRRIQNRAESDYQISIATERSIQGQYEGLRREAAKISDKAVSLAVARQEADQSRLLYEDLLRRTKEVSILANWHTSDITVVDHAITGARPATPNIPEALAAALFGGLILGSVGAFGIDLLDKCIKTVREAQRASGQKAAAILPVNVGTTWPIIRSAEPHTPAAQYRESVRRLLWKLIDGEIPNRASTVLITSLVGDEGVFQLSSSLAGAGSESGRRVLLVDGFPESLEGSHNAQISQSEKDPNLYLLNAWNGQNSGEVQKHRLRDMIAAWQRDYGIVILNAPGTLISSSPFLLHQVVDKTVLLSKLHSSLPAQLRESADILRSASSAAQLLVVVGGLRGTEDDYSAYFGSAVREAKHA